jgi:hypothetical protein
VHVYLAQAKSKQAKKKRNVGTTTINDNPSYSRDINKLGGLLSQADSRQKHKTVSENKLKQKQNGAWLKW